MCLRNLVFLPPLIFLPPIFTKICMIFVPPRFFQGRRLRPCFNGVDAPAFQHSCDGLSNNDNAENNNPETLHSIHYTRTLRSSDSNLLFVSRARTCFGSRSFAVAAPTIWNSLPLAIRSSVSTYSFRRRLKTCFPAFLTPHSTQRLRFGRSLADTVRSTNWLTYLLNIQTKSQTDSTESNMTLNVWEVKCYMHSPPIRPDEGILLLVLINISSSTYSVSQ